MKSPSAKKRNESEIVDTMGFAKAMHRLLDKNNLTRVSWGDTNLYIFLEEGDVGLLKLHRVDDVVTDLVLCRRDFEADDWVVV